MNIISRWMVGLFVLLPLGLASASIYEAEQGMAVDMDGDGQSELVRILIDTPGGSGTFYYLVLINSNERGEPVFQSAFVGDRVQVIRMWKDQDQIALDVLQAGEGDAACCPTHKVIRRWKLQGGGLVEQAPEPYGRLSIEDLKTAKWQLVAMDGESLPGDVGVTLVFGEKNRVAGKSACNNYNTQVEEPSSGRLKFGMSLVSTKMACPENRMKLEQAYLQHLQKVNAYHWTGDHLQLDWQEGDQYGSLLFRKMKEN
ncbi:META domain-containing protein [Thiolapillus sp.]